MCGIVGLYLKNKKYNKDLGKFLTGMMNNMSTRGPDSAGFAIYSTERKKKYKYSICYNENNIKEIKKNLIKEIKADNYELFFISSDIYRDLENCL